MNCLVPPLLQIFRVTYRDSHSHKVVFLNLLLTIMDCAFAEHNWLVLRSCGEPFNGKMISCLSLSLSKTAVNTIPQNVASLNCSVMITYSSMTSHDANQKRHTVDSNMPTCITELRSFLAQLSGIPCTLLLIISYLKLQTTKSDITCWREKSHIGLPEVHWWTTLTTYFQYFDLSDIIGYRTLQLLISDSSQFQYQTTTTLKQ